uniref:Uncharacterized protein n=1 Tax=Myoviridae sp. ctQQg4 TaxID=2827686 RepID=A0A8S5T8P8_9CAUD|nr:MAG TPA: hypothetical protein [Myoviridae sp. ctQQg4]
MVDPKINTFLLCTLFFMLNSRHRISYKQLNPLVKIIVNKYDINIIIKKVSIAKGVIIKVNFTHAIRGSIII